MVPLSPKAAKVTVLQLADQFLQVCLVVGIARTCELRLLGTYMAITAFWHISSQLVDFGLNHVLMKESSQFENIFPQTAIVLSIKAAALTGLTLVLVIWAGISRSLLLALLVFTIPVVAVRCTSLCFSAILAGKDRLLQTAVYQVITRIMLVIGVWGILWQTRRVEYAVAIHLVLESGLLLAFWQAAGRFDLACFKQWRFQSCKFFLQSGAITGLTLTGIQLLIRQPLFWMEHFSSPDTALYGLAVRALDVLLIPVNAFLLVLLPQAMTFPGPTENFSFFRKLFPLWIFFMIASLAFKILSPPVFAMISPDLAPLDHVFWAVFCAAGLVAILYALCFSLFVTQRLAAACRVITGINALLALCWAFSHHVAVPVHTIHTGILILNVSVAMSVIIIWISAKMY